MSTIVDQFNKIYQNVVEGVNHKFSEDQLQLEFIQGDNYPDFDLVLSVNETSYTPKEIVSTFKELLQANGVTRVLVSNAEYEDVE